MNANRILALAALAGLYLCGAYAGWSVYSGLQLMKRLGTDSFMDITLAFAGVFAVCLVGVGVIHALLARRSPAPT